MKNTQDQSVLLHIRQLTEKEEDLYGKTDLSEQDVHQVKSELDQYWDFLRQRRSLRDAGQNPDDANIRPAKVVENYKQ